MQITSNTIQAVTAFYKRELSEMYSESELRNITRWVLEHQLKTPAAGSFTGTNTRINESDLVKLEQMCYKLKNNVPYQYVLGESEFYGLICKVTPAVLIPRPETEELVERVIKSARTSALAPQPSPFAPCILDIGTGSGCIPISIKKNIPEAKVYGLDISNAALDIAKQNAELNKVQVNFFKADILTGDAKEIILSHTNGEKLDILISNPPYVLNSEKDSLHKRVLDHEPHLALFVEDNDPILFYRKIAGLASSILKKNGRIFFECHTLHVGQVAQMLAASGFTNVKVHADLSGLARFAEATTN